MGDNIYKVPGFHWRTDLKGLNSRTVLDWWTWSTDSSELIGKTGHENVRCPNRYVLTRSLPRSFTRSLAYRKTFWRWVFTWLLHGKLFISRSPLVRDRSVDLYERIRNPWKFSDLVLPDTKLPGTEPFKILLFLLHSLRETHTYIHVCVCTYTIIYSIHLIFDM